MELIDPTKAKTAEYNLGDVALVVKTEANEDDRLQVAFAGRRKGDPWSAEQSANFMRLVCRLMVVGWKGVTQGGQPVDYEFELLKHLPRPHGKNLFLDLGMFIIKETDIQKGPTEEAKKS